MGLDWRFSTWGFGWAWRSGLARRWRRRRRGAGGRHVHGHRGAPRPRTFRLRGELQADEIEEAGAQAQPCLVLVADTVCLTNGNGWSPGAAMHGIGSRHSLLDEWQRQAAALSPLDRSACLLGLRSRTDYGSQRPMLQIVVMILGLFFRSTFGTRLNSPSSSVRLDPRFFRELEEELLEKA